VARSLASQCPASAPHRRADFIARDYDRYALSERSARRLFFDLYPGIALGARALRPQAEQMGYRINAITFFAKCFGRISSRHSDERCRPSFAAGNGLSAGDGRAPRDQTIAI